MSYGKCLFLNLAIGITIAITGVVIMPPTGGPVPLNETPEQFYQDQRTMILNSSGFKMTMAGSAIIILMLILLIRNHLLEEALDEAREARQARSVQVLPYPPVQAQSLQAKPLPQVQAKPEAKPQAKPLPQVQAKLLPQQKLEELKEIIVVPEVPKIQHLTHELLPPRYPIMTMAPRMTMPPRAPIAPFRTFKYPPPYEAFNKK